MGFKQVARRFSKWLSPGRAALLVAGLATGCASDAEVIDAAGTTGLDNGKVAAGKADHWNWTNSPDRLNMQLEYQLDKLPKEGHAERTPWPDTYWPTYEDSTNVHWQGRQGATRELSPVQKYDLAFNGWTKPEGFDAWEPYNSTNCEAKSWSKDYYEKLGPAATWQSANKGNAAARDGLDSDDDGKTDECDDRDGVESWWGLCHAWVPAALLEPEPQRAVTYNGVTFEVSDLKALLISQYDRSQAVMVGGRCNDKEMKFDEHGRALSDECRDTNAGTWHVVMANLLGINKRALAEDRTGDYEVWNQPVLAWAVQKLDQIQLPRVAELLNRPELATTYSLNPNAVTFYEVHASSDWIRESSASKVPYTDVISEYTKTDNYTYILEINKDGKIDGGEWTGDSIKNHPDFLWLPTASRGGNPSMDLTQIRMLVEMSLKPEQEEAPTADLIVHSNTNPFPIADNDPKGTSSTIDVGDDMTVAGLDVDLDVTHAFIGDLKIVLKKDGKEVVLHDNAGGSTHNLKRSYKVTDFDGTPAKGTWELFVADTASSDVGKLNSWKLKLHVPGPGTPEGGTLTAENTVAVALAEGPDGASNTLRISEGKQIKGVRVTVALTYTAIGALTVELTHGVVKATLSASEGGDATELNRTFDVTGFNGLESNGDWTLHIVDAIEVDTEATGATGSLTSWNLEVQY